MVNIAVDAMGGDNAPEEIVKGALQAVMENKDLTVTLVGDENKIKPLISKNKTNRIIIKNASEVITNNDKPVQAFKEKKDSSMVVGLELVKDNVASAFISAGNTGALLVSSQFILGKKKGVKRAALAPVLPTKENLSLIIDCGANMDSKPEYLQQFAHIATDYLRSVYKIKNPTVGIVNVGVEEGKGNALVKETYEILKNDEYINFYGNIEATDIPNGKVNIVLCDAFVGNVIIKLFEGTAKVFLSELKATFMTNIFTKLAAMVIKKPLNSRLERYDVSNIGGAVLLGLNNLVVKVHGNSKAKDVKIGIRQCYKYVKNNINEKF